MILGFIIWLVLCGLCAWYASTKGRSGIGFFFLAFFLSPLIGFIAAAIAADLKEEQKIKEQKVAEAKRYPCPFCSEAILKTAKLCPFCKSELPVYVEPVKPVSEKDVLLGEFEKFRLQFNASDDKEERKKLEKQMKEIQNTLYSKFGIYV